MGILNVTPDSFSDGGRFFDRSAAIEHGLQLAAEGADVIDIGGESTRPYSTPVSIDEELDRTIPVVQALCEQTTVPISIDTSKAKVAHEAMAAGAEMINDVTGLTGDPAMVDVALASQAGVCVMHMRGTPQSMQDNPQYGDVVREIRDYLASRCQALITMGICAERICVDPGIGFGKTTEHNLTLIRNIDTFLQLGYVVLVGHSRKGFLGRIWRIGDLEHATLGVSLAMAARGVHVIRVHDVAATNAALDTFLACEDRANVPCRESPS